MDLTAKEEAVAGSKIQDTSLQKHFLIGSRVTNSGRGIPRTCHLFSFNDLWLLVLAKVIFFATGRLAFVQKSNVPILQ